MTATSLPPAARAQVAEVPQLPKFRPIEDEGEFIEDLSKLSSKIDEFLKLYFLGQAEEADFTKLQKSIYLIQVYAFADTTEQEAAQAQEKADFLGDIFDNSCF